MKLITGTLTTLTLILGILYFTIGGTILLIGLSTIGLLTIILSCFGLGIWYAHQSIQLGAKIAIDVNNNNDRWDSVKMQGLAQFGKEIFKLKADNQATNGFPLLESNNDMLDATFTITGVDMEGE